MVSRDVHPGYAAPSFAVHCAAVAGVPSEILERAAQVTQAQLQVAARAASHDMILPMAGAVLDWDWCQVEPRYSCAGAFAFLHPAGRQLTAVAYRDSPQWCLRCRAEL